MKEEILKIMPHPLKQMLMGLNSSQWTSLQEIRIRMLKPIILVTGMKEHGLNNTGFCSIKESFMITQKEMTGLLQFISSFSLYALEDELRQGYITIEGGHRVGLVGTVVSENNRIKTLKHIFAINIRIAHEVIGCSNKVLPYLIKNQGIYHTMILSPPKCGKTTLLRDLIRNLSNGFTGSRPYTVGVVDERSEIGACYRGIPQKDIGIRTDLLDGCPKAVGMRMLLRSMAPEIIAVDEMGGKEDLEALQEMLRAGVTILCTMHGKSIEEYRTDPYIKQMLEHQMIERVIILSNRHGPCTIESILDVKNNLTKLR
jgi:stage III sporulation protein AA